MWEDFLIGFFLEKDPHIAKIHAIVNKIWTAGDKTQTGEEYPINAAIMKFRICNSPVRGRILRRGMWNLAEIPVVMSKLPPFPYKTQKEEKTIPMWVHMKNVPISMFSWKGFSIVAELLTSMKFNYQGEETMVEFIYPWLPSKCTNCNKWGHLAKACLVEKEQTNLVSVEKTVAADEDTLNEKEIEK
ncbi:hypothetical protein N665_0886s0001 [Sinapis alba]|nr:hypothetical protein N665_0886s0001 [Sinapis alba]